MEIKVIKPFCDKYNLAKMYNPGEIVDFEQSRAESIIDRGLGKPVRKVVAPKPAIEESNESPSVSEDTKMRKPRQKKAE